MKKIFLILAVMIIMSTTSYAARNEIILPTVEVKSNELSVTEALQKRMSSRNFVDKDLTPAQMARILWAANGINRENGKRVNPAALGVYSVEVYAVTREGIYFYDATKNTLKLIAEGDYRSITTTGQSFVGNAAVNLVYVENPDAWKTARHTPPPRDAQISFANVIAGAMVQSVALISETEGLGNCVRGSINRAEFAKVARIPDEKNILLAQSVGKCN